MKKILPVAVLAALAGVNGAQAVHVNSDGLGQVLLYPFYSTEASNDTYINLVNTTADWKAVKIRVLESMNSREVLDFNLYLSPFDHWSAVITRTEGASTGGNIVGASITSADTSCTVPQNISNGESIPFRNFEFTEDSVNGLERTQEGYVEVIEMGTVVDSELRAAIKHVNGVPGDCDLLSTEWAAGGEWANDSDYGMSVVTGGLYGYGVLIDVPRGAAGGYDAVALDNWADPFSDIQHTFPGSIFPSIGGGTQSYDVFAGEDGVVSGVADSGWDAVSAVLMHDTLSNDFVLEPSILAGTDWVVTFPTKRQYVNGLGAPVEPFTDEWDPETSTSCESFLIGYRDREERIVEVVPDLPDFSPLPPAGKPQVLSFCAEANVLTFNESNVLSASDRTGYNLQLEQDFSNGWAKISFANEVGSPAERYLEAGANTFLGLPAVGFAVQRYLNGNTIEVDGAIVIGNYGVAIGHRGTRALSDD